MEDAMEGYPVQPRRYGVLKKKKVEEAEGGVGLGFGKGIGMGMGMGESVVVPAPRFGVLKKKKKMLEVERIEPPPPQPTIDAPRFGVLKKRKAPKPARPNLVLATVDDSATESEGDGNDGGSMLMVAPPTRTAKREPRAKGVLKRKLVASEGQSRKVMRTSSPPPDHLPPVVVVEVQQPKAADRRKAMIKELAATYRNECQTYCRQLLLLQRQWRQQEIPILPQAQPDAESTRGLSLRKKDGPRRLGAAGRKSLKSNANNSAVNSEENDDAPVQLVNGKMPLRRRVAWRANERESLRRGLMMFGLGRSEKVRSIMRTMLKLTRHGLGDIADCCWEFVRCCGVLAEPKEKEYAEKRLQDAKEQGIEMGPEVTERVGEWDKMEKNSSVWLKRLKLLDSLADVVRICANKETREAAYRAIDLLRDASVPNEGWGREADLALLAGVYKHGFGNYEALRKDEQFAEAFERVFHTPADRGDSGGDDTDPQSSSREKPEWPDANTLTRRLKRLVDHVTRVGQQVGGLPMQKQENRSALQVNKVQKVAESPQVPRSLKWSKRDKMEFLRQLMRWGLPLAPGRAKVRWQQLTEKSTNASFKKRNDSSLEACYRDIFREMKQLVDGPDVYAEDGLEKANGKRKRNSAAKKPPAKGQVVNLLEQGALSPNAPQEPVGPSILNEKSAGRLKERLELLDTLRQVPESLQDDDWDTLGLALHHGHDMPVWWEAGIHDNSLIKGVLAHGYGFWDDIFADDTLEFPDDIAGREAEDGLSQSAKPTPKACLKRVKFIVNNLRRYLRKLKVLQPTRRKRPAPEGKEPKEPKELKEPKRFKYARAVEVPRDDDSRPILPLVLTDRLALVDLGRIEPDRPGFHTERHIFPIGFTTLRDHASMVDPNGRTQYTCIIIDSGGPGPLFRVFPEDDPDLVIEKDSASGAWVVVCAAVNRVRGIDREKVTVSGTEMFGLSHPEVCRLIQELPGAELCRNFRPELSFSRFGPQVVARPIGEDHGAFLHPESPPSRDLDRGFGGRRLTNPYLHAEVDEGGRDEMPLALWHVNKAREASKGKGLFHTPMSQQYRGHHQSLDFDDRAEEEEEEEEEEDVEVEVEVEVEENEEDNNGDGDGESTEDDD